MGAIASVPFCPFGESRPDSLSLWSPRHPEAAKRVPRLERYSLRGIEFDLIVSLLLV